MTLVSRLFCIALLGSIAGTSQANTACHTEQARHDRVEVRCTWPTGAQGLRFDAHLAGSHDDTEATLTATLNGTPLSCASGSKTTIDGSKDEGDVTLSCHLAPPPAATGSAQLRFQLRWYHARYTGFELKAAPAP